MLILAFVGIWDKLVMDAFALTKADLDSFSEIEVQMIKNRRSKKSKTNALDSVFRSVSSLLSAFIANFSLPAGAEIKYARCNWLQAEIA